MKQYEDSGQRVLHLSALAEPKKARYLKQNTAKFRLDKKPLIAKGTRIRPSTHWSYNTRLIFL